MDRHACNQFHSNTNNNNNQLANSIVLRTEAIAYRLVLRLCIYSYWCCCFVALFICCLVACLLSVVRLLLALFSFVQSNIHKHIQ